MVYFSELEAYEECSTRNIAGLSVVANSRVCDLTAGACAFATAS